MPKRVTSKSSRCPSTQHFTKRQDNTYLRKYQTDEQTLCSPVQDLTGPGFKLQTSRTSAHGVRAFIEGGMDIGEL